MQRGDIAMMHIRDFPIGGDVTEDVPDYHTIVVPRLLGLARKMLDLVTLGQVGHGRRFTPLTPLVCRVIASVNSLPGFLGLGTCGGDRPIRPGTDAEAAQ